MKIQFRLTKEDQSHPLMINPEYIKALRDMGIEYVSGGQDFILAHSSAVDQNLLDTGAPIVILERTDSTNLIRKKELGLSNVLGVIKNTVLRPMSLNNASYYHGRYHNKIMWDLMPNKNESPYNIELTEVKPQLTDENLKKVICGYSFCHYDKMSAISKLSIDFDKTRSNDIHFMGTLDYGKNIVSSYHRHLALEKINDLKHTFKISDGGRAKPTPMYIQDLLNSKIVLSPWGHGEACYRDFEAIFCGCILLKPDSSFVESWPDIYQNDKTYIPCKADFSDLQEKVDWIKSSWNSLKDFRKKNLNLILDARKPENFANRMYNIFNDCLKRIP